MIINKKAKEISTVEIKEKALDFGFDLVGIASAEPFIEAFSKIKDKKLSKFVKNDKELLTNPAKHLSSVKSIISLALSYASKENNNNEEQYISLYARGNDYHYVMEEKMGQLISFLKSRYRNLDYLAYCDTGAILDREVAYRAGLGWIGKSNNLINPYYGSYLVLGEILTNLDLLIDHPIESKCGNCQLCIINCPTQALNEYDLDSDKCLSYISQKKGILTENERSIMKNRLWGCDRCLQSCPYNQDIPVDLHSKFFPIIKADIKKIMGFTKENFPKEWKKSALSWRGLRILKRNTIINIANIGNNEYVPLLQKELKSSSPVIRAYAVWAMCKLLGKDFKADLIKFYQQEKDKFVKEEIERIMKNYKWGELND